MKREIGIDELKKIQIAVLDTVVSYCTEHNLRYYLGYGTLLGAIRHKGYIPWDDDIDIVMPRPDYEKLLANFDNEKSSYKIKAYQSYCKAYDGRTIFIEEVKEKFEIGINIDIFPLDGMPDSVEECNSLLKKTILLYKLYSLKIMQWRTGRRLYKNLFLMMTRIPLAFCSKEMLINKIVRLSKQYDYEKSKNVAMGVASYGVNECMDKRIFEGAATAFFEGKEYVIPQGYKEYLTNIYGDYMQLPPLDQQVSHHSFKAYWK